MKISGAENEHESDVDDEFVIKSQQENFLAQNRTVF